MQSFDEYIRQEPIVKLAEFMNTRSITNRKASYYVNWEKVYSNSERFEIELNTLNYLIGKDNIQSVAKELFLQQPNLLKVIPVLIATRDFRLHVLDIDNNANFNFRNIDFDTIDIEKIDEYIDFIDQTGLFNFLSKHANKSLVDYVYGVEAGLDSNGRKNRSGTQNEEILQLNLEKISQNENWEYATQANVEQIQTRWNIDTPVDKSKRRYDGVVYNPDNNSLTIIETNFYGGGGSKLKSVAGEFTELNEMIATADANLKFVWISDGPGWDTARLPMAAAFEHIPYIINLKMVDAGYLKSIIEL